MEIEGKIIAVIPAREGVSPRTGNSWKSQDYVIETHDQYPRRCCFNVFGADKIQLFNIQTGEELRVSFDIDAHEYQGRWFNQIRAWKVERIDPNVAQPAVQPAPLNSLLRFSPCRAALLWLLRLRPRHSLLNKRAEAKTTCRSKPDTVCNDI